MADLPMNDCDFESILLVYQRETLGLSFDHPPDFRYRSRVLDVVKEVDGKEVFVPSHDTFSRKIMNILVYCLYRII